jgi:DNA-binding phage protein
MATTTATDSYHDRRLARRLEDPEYREQFERAYREIATIDAIVNMLDCLRDEHGISKAELARRIEKNPAHVRRLLTASGNPELRTVVAMADALDADVKIVPRRRTRRTSTSRSRASSQSRVSSRASNGSRGGSRSRRGSKSRSKDAVEA